MSAGAVRGCGERGQQIAADAYLEVLESGEVSSGQVGEIARGGGTTRENLRRWARRHYPARVAELGGCRPRGR